MKVEKVEALAFTAERSFWPAEESQDNHFLGLWCLKWPEIEESSRDRVLPYPFDDRDRLFASYGKLDDYYHQMLPKLAASLNGWHGTHHSTKYWEIFVGYWFKNFLEVVFNRYTLLKEASGRHPDAKVCLMCPGDFRVPMDLLQFVEFQLADRYNQQLFSQITSHFDWFPNSRIVSGFPQSQKISPAPKVKRIAQTLGLFGSRFNSFYLTSCYLNPSQILKLSKALKIFPNLGISRFFCPQKVNFDRRSQLPTWASTSEFEGLIGAIVFQNMPSIYLEGYQWLRSQVQLWFPKKPKLMATSVAFAGNEGFKLWVAEVKERSSVPYVILQHGGTYGSAKWYSSEDYERSVADYYVTYGWSESPDQRRQAITVPFYGNKLEAQRKPTAIRESSVGGKALWVLTSFPRYPYIYYATPSGPAFHSYLDDQVSFYNSAQGPFNESLLCRGYPRDYGWGDRQFLESQCKGIEFDSFEVSVQKRLDQVRAVVATQNSTVFLEALAKNLPTVAFWDPNHWELRPSAKALHQRLEEVGILHASGSAASQHLSEVWPNLEEWWFSKQVQQVREEFCQEYARSTSAGGAEWSELFKKLANQNQSLGG